MKPFQSVVADTYALFKQILDDSNKGRYDAELWQYCSLFATPEGTAREVRYVYDLCRLAHFDPQDKVILDAGCGFGRLAFVLMMMGAQKVCGIDLYENRLYTLQHIIQDYNLSEKLEAFLEDVAQMHYANQTFDMVLSVEAISHYYDVLSALKEIARVLKRGGVFVIADGNNGANRRVRRELYDLWERWENGPAGVVGIHTISEPYVERRRRLIQEAFPQIGEAQVQELARRTSGMRREAILEAVQRFLKEGEMPTSFYERGQCPCEPISGSRAEYAFDPRELVRMIADYGFDARYYAYFGGAGGNPIIRLANAIGQALSPLTISVAESYRVIARKVR